MVSKTTRTHVWLGLLDMVTYHRYFALLESKYRRKYIAVRIFLAVSAILTVGPLIPSVPPVVSSIGGFLVICVVVWDLHQDYGKNVAALGIIVGGLDRLVDSHRWLWADTFDSNVSDAEARDQTNRIREEARNLVNKVDISNDKKLYSECWKETTEMEKTTYGT